jgi:hypothetical protein
MKSKKIVFTLLLILFLGASLSAQVTQTGAIIGVIKDKQGEPLPGVNLVLTSPSLLGSMSAVTKESGEFRFLYLPPGVYTIVASLQGFQTVKREGIIVRVGMTVTINLEMPEESLEYEVKVVAPSPTVDVLATRTGTSLSLPGEVLKQLPVARTDVNLILQLAPGAVYGSGPVGSQQYSIKGESEYAHSYNIDGVSQNEPLSNAGEAYVSWDTIEEVEVVAGGTGVESFGGVGGALNIVTKSGGNRFNGEAQIYYTNKHLSDAVVPPDKLAAVGSSLPPVPKVDYDYSFLLGGPIIRDRIWFLANFRHTVWERTSTVMQIPL